MSYVKNQNDEWFRCNDMTITSISEEDFLDYVLYTMGEVMKPHMLLFMKVAMLTIVDGKIEQIIT